MDSSVGTVEVGYPVEEEAAVEPSVGEEVEVESSAAEEVEVESSVEEEVEVVELEVSQLSRSRC